MLAIVAALHQELSALLARMPHERRVVLAGREFWQGELHGQPLVCVLSRVGKVAAATTAALLLDRFEAEALVFTGVAGGLADAVNVGDVVVAASLLQHDLDASPLFPRYEVPLTGHSRFATDTGLSDAIAAAAQAALADPVALVGASAARRFSLHEPRLHRGLVVSGDRFISTSADSGMLRDALPQALAVEMEGAAVAQVCHDFQVPFAAVRTISDRADDSAHTDFMSFMAEVASRYSLAIVEGWLRGRGGVGG